MSDSVQIIDYRPEFKKDYIAINEAWIKKDYTLEELDIQELHNLEEYILKDGGAIILALIKDKVVGTCALQYKEKGVFEMVKMAVNDGFKGLGIGNKLCEGIIDKAKELNANEIILYSNTQYSVVAIKLYRKYGFIEIPLGKTDWNRADIKMELNLL